MPTPATTPAPSTDLGAASPELPPGLPAFVEAARAALGGALRSIVLFGSAAEGRLRATSDVNVLLLLRSFPLDAVERLRAPLQLAEVGMRLAPMFVLEEELAAVEAAFANKFMDIGRRHRVLYGDDPFASLDIPRAAVIARVRQVLLNLLLRLRERYVSQSLREERLALVVADVAGPLRGAAATLLALDAGAAPPPREALEALARALGGEAFAPALRALSQARETGALPPGVAREAALALLDLTGRMYQRAAGLKAKRDG